MAYACNDRQVSSNARGLVKEYGGCMDNGANVVQHAGVAQSTEQPFVLILSQIRWMMTNVQQSCQRKRKYAKQKLALYGKLGIGRR